MIEQSSRNDAVAIAREAYGLGVGTTIDDAYLASALRRAAGHLCPCSPRTLVSAIAELHRGLAQDDAFETRVEDILDSLVAHGDLLELSDVTTLDDRVKGTWLFAAPPAFMVRTSGSALLLGLSADEALPLPQEIKDRVRYQGAARFLDPAENEPLADMLQGFGFRQLSQDAWLRPPKREGAQDMLASLDARLSQQGRAGDVEGLQILDDTRVVRRYRDRWQPARSQSGIFIVRRPQAYGADLWGYGELDAGRLVRLIDLPGSGSRWRGCDVAWRIQMARDALADRHQRYRLLPLPEGMRFDFFWPIPDFARRRLAALGQILPADHCLMSYFVGAADADEEAAFLSDYLFLKPSEPEEPEA